MKYYRAYGQRIAANRDLLLFPSNPAWDCVDLHIWLGDDPPDRNAFLGLESDFSLDYSSDSLDDNGQPALNVYRNSHGDMHASYSAVIDFYINADATRLWGFWADASWEKDLLSFLAGPVMGLVLRQRGIICLHACCIEIQGNAVLFLGPSEAGKSTLLAAFCQRGYAGMSDDVVGMVQDQNIITALPAYPCARLRPESLSLLNSGQQPRPLATTVWTTGRHYLDINNNGHRYQNDELPIAAIYVLPDAQHASTEPEIYRMDQPQALLGLIGNSFGNKLITKSERAAEFAFLSMVCELLPLWGISNHLRKSTFTDQLSIIEDHAHRTIATHTNALSNHQRINTSQQPANTTA